MKQRLVITLLIAVGVVALFGQPAVAVDIIPNCQTTGGASCSIVKEDRLNYMTGATGVWGVIQLVMTILGAVAVIMIVIGGIKYTISQGDSSALTSAKNTILYSVIGLVVAISATAIIGFVSSYFA